ncbi:MAG: class I SAM-dependent methyltransferase [Prosthecobacter sp.]
MNIEAVKTYFGPEQAAAYDQQYAKMGPLRDALHLLMEAILCELPSNARILCVGAGTGAEIIRLALRFPGWHFMAVDPSGPMLDVCRRRVGELGLSSRCGFHEGYLDSLPASETSFDAATSILVSHFILAEEERRRFFSGIVTRLRSGGLLVNADLAGDTSSPSYDSLLEVWMRVMSAAEITAEKRESIRAAYGKAVAFLPPDKLASLIQSAGFEAPVQFLQTGLIHAWHARKAAS